MVSVDVQHHAYLLINFTCEQARSTTLWQPLNAAACLNLNGLLGLSRWFKQCNGAVVWPQIPWTLLWCEMLIVVCSNSPVSETPTSTSCPRCCKTTLEVSRCLLLFSLPAPLLFFSSCVVSKTGIGHECQEQIIKSNNSLLFINIQSTKMKIFLIIEKQKAWPPCCFLLKVRLRKIDSSEQERRDVDLGEFREGPCQR